MTDISKALVALLNQDRFYADLVMRLNRVYTTSIPTMAVSLRNGGTLLINPNFWADNAEYHTHLLQHECLHLLLDHFGRGKETGYTMLFNVAADLAINDMIEGFPNQMFVDHKLTDLATVSNAKIKYPAMEHNKSFEYYMEFLKQQSGEGGKGGEEDGEGGPGGMQTVDDHSGWGDENVTQEEAKAIVRDLVDKAVESCKNAGKQVPDAVRPYIESLYDSGIGWDDVLKSVPECAEVAYYESSRKRRNRRYGLDFPGEKVVRRCSIVVGFDVSGSITDEVVAKFAKVLDEIKMKADVRVIFFDHAIQQELDYEPGCLSGNLPGGGGTLFAPVFERAKELDADALIMLTDGMMADEFGRPTFPTFWGILEGFSCPVDWGTVVQVK